MGKGIYTYYKERLIEIGGNNKCLYLKNVSRKSAYDLGKIFEGRDDKIAEFVDFIWSGKTSAFTLIDKSEKKDILRNLDAKSLEKVDVLISPTCPHTAFDIGSKVSDPLSMYLTDIATITANLAGIPAMNIPVGLDSTGMPIGLQLQANCLNENKLLNVAFKLEEAVQFNYNVPAMTLV